MRLAFIFIVVDLNLILASDSDDISPGKPSINIISNCTFTQLGLACMLYASQKALRTQQVNRPLGPKLTFGPPSLCANCGVTLSVCLENSLELKFCQKNRQVFCYSLYSRSFRASNVVKKCITFT